MRRVVLVAALAALLPSVPAAEPVSAPTPDALVAGAAVDGSVRVALTVNGNVRFAPTKQAKVVVMLKPGSEVEILGKAKVPGWYVIRFPREGNAWVHSKVLKALDGGKRWLVTEDKARARDDSTLRSEIVAELNKGEVLEDKGRVNGDWRAVYLPNAVAYIHESLLNLPADMSGAVAAAGERAKSADVVWSKTQAVYGAYYAALAKNPQDALVLDWDGLSQQLDTVIGDHRDPDVRVSAKRLKDGIVNVSAAAVSLQKARGITPIKDPAMLVATLAPELPARPAVATTPTAPAATVPAPTAAVAANRVVDVGDPSVPDKLVVPVEAGAVAAAAEAKPVAPDELVPVAPAANPGVAAAPFAAEGFVSQKSVDALGVTEVLVDGDSNVVAFIKVPAGKDIQLSEYYWRWVGVRGDVQKTDAAKHGLGRDIPLITVDSVSLSGR